MKTVKELWDDLFDSSLENYKHEDEAIRNLAMILQVLKLEYKKVSQYILDLKCKNSLQSKEISEYKQKAQLCGCKCNNRTPLKTLVENYNVIETTPKKKSYGNQNVSTYFDNSDDDMFNNQISELDVNVSKENDNLFVDNSIIVNDSVDFDISCSPTLNKSKKKRLSRAKIKKLDDINASIKDLVIMNTPTPKMNTTKKFKQTKLTTTTINSVSKSKSCTFTKNETTNAHKSLYSDETLFLPAQQNNENYGDTEVLDMLQQLRDVASPKNKKIKLENSFDFIPENESESPDFVYQRDAVRKKSERMKLQGWDCADCEKYYATYKNQLSDEEIKKKMDECSRHRNKFNPNILTPKGFWNPNFSPTQDSMAFDI